MLRLCNSFKKGEQEHTLGLRCFCCPSVWYILKYSLGDWRMFWILLPRELLYRRWFSVCSLPGIFLKSPESLKEQGLCLIHPFHVFWLCTVVMSISQLQAWHVEAQWIHIFPNYKSAWLETVVGIGGPQGVDRIWTVGNEKWWVCFTVRYLVAGCLSPVSRDVWSNNVSI